jgi:hypothetical protein
LSNISHICIWGVELYPLGSKKNINQFYFILEMFLEQKRVKEKIEGFFYLNPNSTLDRYNDTK